MRVSHALRHAKPGSALAARQSMLQYERALVPRTTPEHPEAAAARRWMRDANETCVQGVMKSQRLLTNYVATYKFGDPQWRSILALPCGNPVSLELRGRHVVTQLRHLVQKGHAVFVIETTQNTVFHAHGLAERSFVTTSLGKTLDHLVCTMYHEGPLDAANPHGDRGVVAASVVTGRPTAFARKPMLVDRTRRVGGLQAQMGAFSWVTHAPPDVGRRLAHESMLLADHTRVLGGGVFSTGIVSSQQVAQHDTLYMHEFEAPSVCAVEAMSQLAYLTARKGELVADGEPLHWGAWITETPWPWAALEADLPFKLQASRPTVARKREHFQTRNVGVPFAEGLFTKLDMHLFQGAPEYVYEGAGPVSRPRKYWSQKDSNPYKTAAYLVRDGNLPQLVPYQRIKNPFEAATTRSFPSAAVSPEAARDVTATRDMPSLVASGLKVNFEPGSVALARKARSDKAAERLQAGTKGSKGKKVSKTPAAEKAAKPKQRAAPTKGGDA